MIEELKELSNQIGNDVTDELEELFKDPNFPEDQKLARTLIYGVIRNGIYKGIAGTLEHVTRTYNIEEPPPLVIEAKADPRPGNIVNCMYPDDYP